MNSANQSGISLVSMLVGMLIALLSVTALLSQYRLQVHTSVNTIGVAQREGQLASALLTAGQLLQQAGYGIEDALVSNASVLSVNEYRVVWHFKPDLIADACTGLQLDGGLFLLPESPCSSASTVTWDDADRVPLVTAEAAMFVPLARDGQELTDEVRPAALDQAIFQRSTENCTLPYAQQSADATASPQISLVIPATGETPQQVLFTACLANIGV